MNLLERISKTGTRFKDLLRVFGGSCPTASTQEQPAYFHSPGITQRKVPICLLQLRSLSELRDNRSPAGSAQPQEGTKQSRRQLSRSGPDLNPQLITSTPPASPLSTSVPPIPHRVLIVLHFVFIDINTKRGAQTLQYRNDPHAGRYIPGRPATTAATRELFFFPLLHQAVPVFQGQKGFFLKLGKHCLQ